ncbi:MAG TPA: hypothetical protein VGR25_07315 [bacterium]|jgi:hypothetical protein|nr:hypothetical protein [bacterium]
MPRRPKKRGAAGWLGAAQEGVAMVSAMLAIFILTVVVAALALATMGETGLSFDQSRSSQVMQLAEAGAYRALGQLRRRIALDLVDQLAAVPASAIQNTLHTMCHTRQGWRIIHDFAYPSPGPSDWVEENIKKRALLRIGTQAAPIDVRDAGGTLLGSFYATIYVRPAENSGGVAPEAECDHVNDKYRLWFDSFIVSTAVTRNATATVCLKNVGNLVNCGAWLAAGNPGDVSWDTAPPTHGWEVLIARASYSRWALMTLGTSATWMITGSDFLGPVHTNDRFSIWGNPAFYSTVTQFQNDVNFGSGGVVADDNYCPPSHPGGTDCPAYNGPRMTRNAAQFAAPGADSPFWAVLDQISVGVPSNSQIRSQTTALPNGSGAIPAGIYFMDECANPTCGGIMVQGDVSNMVLCVAGLGSPPCPTGPSVNGLQHIVVTIPGGTTKMYVLDPGGVQECTGPPSYSTCVNKGKGFNGVIYVNGNITASPGNPSTGLFGKLAQSSKITIAADGEITITNMLVYEYVPRQGDPFDPLPTVLGVYSWCSSAPTCPGRNVTVGGSMSPNDLHIYGSILTPWGKFWVKGWDTIADKGTLTLIGGTVQQDFGEFGGFLTDSFGNIIGYTGYGRDMIYDARFQSSFAPPFFPLTDRYTADRASVNPDNFYDRPLWEELAAP